MIYSKIQSFIIVRKNNTLIFYMADELISLYRKKLEKKPKVIRKIKFKKRERKNDILA
jgi:uncharacterized spore protein YtfJ